MSIGSKVIVDFLGVDNKDVCQISVDAKIGIQLFKISLGLRFNILPSLNSIWQE